MCSHLYSSDQSCQIIILANMLKINIYSSMRVMGERAVEAAWASSRPLSPESSSVVRSPSSSSSSVVSSALCVTSWLTLALDRYCGSRRLSKSWAWADATIVPTRTMPAEGRRFRARKLEPDVVPVSRSAGAMNGVATCCSCNCTSSP